MTPENLKFHLARENLEKPQLDLRPTNHISKKTLERQLNQLEDLVMKRDLATRNHLQIRSHMELNHHSEIIHIFKNHKENEINLPTDILLSEIEKLSQPLPLDHLGIKNHLETDRLNLMELNHKDKDMEIEITHRDLEQDHRDHLGPVVVDNPQKYIKAN
jgi:hypothetical protein